MFRNYKRETANKLYSDAVALRKKWHAHNITQTGTTVFVYTDEIHAAVWEKFLARVAAKVSTAVHATPLIPSDKSICIKAVI